MVILNTMKFTSQIVYAFIHAMACDVYCFVSVGLTRICSYFAYSVQIRSENYFAFRERIEGETRLKIQTYLPNSTSFTTLSGYE